MRKRKSHRKEETDSQRYQERIQQQKQRTRCVESVVVLLKQLEKTKAIVEGPAEQKKGLKDQQDRRQLKGRSSEQRSSHAEAFTMTLEQMLEKKVVLYAELSATNSRLTKAV